MRRLVYSPYVQAFIKSDYGVFDVSPYIVSGSVDRKVNQVSTAQLTLRNPVQGSGSNLIFTEHVAPGAAEPGPLFHPMDPIIILMTRIQGHPVQVFTGYLDKAPYLQLYPGLCTVEASCTLKRLLYTQWDAALPFVQYFLQQFGWIPNGDTGMVYNPSAETQKIVGSPNSLKGQFNDGSIGALLFAVLNVIGKWDASTIWIEALPPQIRDLVLNLYQQIQTEVSDGQNVFEGMIQAILGGASQGSGAPIVAGASTGNIKDLAQIIPTMVAIATANNLPPLFVVTTWLAEGGVPVYSPQTPNRAQAQGYFQFTSSGPYPGITVPYPSGALDLGISCNAFCRAAAAVAKSGRFNTPNGETIKGGFNINDQSVWETWAEVTQQPAAQAYASYWSAKLQQAQQLIAQYGNGTPVGATPSDGNASSLAPATNLQTGNNPRGTTIVAGTSPGGKTGSGQRVSLTQGTYVTPFTSNSGVGLARTDEGVDFTGAGVQVHAIGNATVVGYSPSGFDGRVFVYQLTDGDHAGNNIYVNEGIEIKAQYQSAGAKINVGDVIGPITNVGTQAGASIEMGFWSGGVPNGHPWRNTDAKDGQPYSTASGRDGRPTEGGWEFTNFLNSIGQQTADKAPAGFSNGTSNSGGATGSAGSGGTDATAAAFSTFINLPSIFSSAEALAFSGKRSFMADQPLFPFVEQLCQASLRNFMSMPNGNFFAFFPDYFGLFGRKYYWEIQDIEIMNGRIDLSDDPLATHVAIVGDVTQLHGSIDVFDQLMTSGIFTIFDALATGYISGPNSLVDTKVTPDPKSKQKAINFLQKYGARPYVDQVPMIRSAFFELFFSFQKFMILWSKQFQTTFELTFIPELFPGGLVALPDHHLQLYVEEVSHTFDYTGGFITTVNFSSPSKLDDSSRNNLSEGLARPGALV